MTLNPFGLKKTIGNSYTMDLDDSLNTKKALADLGHLKIPEFGLTPYPDQAMIDGVKSFQKEQGLKVDGVMKRGGPTINRLNQTLSAERLKAANNNTKEGVDAASQNGKPVQVAGPFLPILGAAALTAARAAAPKAGKAILDASRAASAAAAAQKLLEQQNKRAKARPTPDPANDPYARSEMPDPPRQIPGLTPPGMEELSKGGKTKFPGTPINRPQLDGSPINEQLKNKPYIFAPLKEEMRKLLGGALENRRGNKYTQRGHDLIVGVIWDRVMEAYDDAVKRRIKHTGGGLTADKGVYQIEEHVKKKNAGMKDSSFADLSFMLEAQEEQKQRYLRINTGKTLIDGETPVSDERRKLLKLRHNGELEDVAGTLPKLLRGMDEQEYIERVTPLLKDLVERWIGPPLP